jgi:ketosteroid isomerase-like protein
MAARLRERKLDRIAASEADSVAAANPGCLLQIRAGAIARGIDVDVEHPLDLLAAAHGVGEGPVGGLASRGSSGLASRALAALGAVALAGAIGACRGAGDEAVRPSATPAATAAPPAAEPDGASVPHAEREAIERAIRDQVAAIARGDGPAAFAFAAPAIQEMFATPENFLRMVHAAYAPLVRPRELRFGDTALVAGEITQKVLVIDREGRAVLALYLMDRQLDGAWKILGCVLVPREEMQA